MHTISTHQASSKDTSGIYFSYLKTPADLWDGEGWHRVVRLRATDVVDHPDTVRLLFYGCCFSGATGQLYEIVSLKPGDQESLIGLLSLSTVV